MKGFWLVLMLILRTPRQGAQTTIYCAVAEEQEGVSGRYILVIVVNRCQRRLSLWTKLWKVSTEMVNLLATD